jgi:hypothetical protein
VTAEQIIKLGQEITKPELGWFSQFPWWAWLIVFGFFALGFFLSYWGESELEIGKMILGFFMIPFSCIAIIVMIDQSNKAEDEIYKKDINEWKHEYVKPYIESLPKDKSEIVYIKIDPELSHKTEGYYSWGTGYTYSKAIKLTPLTISFKGNGLETETNWYSTQMKLTNEEKPYLEYNYLDEDLGHGVDKGRYNKEIYLPESYEFTDIK